MVACLLCGLATLLCSALATCAALDHAPAAVVPFIVLVCVACPALLALDVPAATAVLRATRNGADDDALAALRRGLDELPETNHPLGL